MRDGLGIAFLLLVGFCVGFIAGFMVMYGSVMHFISQFFQDTDVDKQLLDQMIRYGMAKMGMG